MNEKKVREAIEYLSGYIQSNINLMEKIEGIVWIGEEPCKTAIEALEKQLPKKTRENGMQDGLIRKIKYYTCPTCGNCLLTEMMNERQNTSYCWDCGQKLDWSE
jgi:hypothetical protein